MAYAVVATTRYVLLVDLDSRQVLPLESERPEYYGISWFPHSDALVLSHSGLDNADLIDIASYATSEKGWISAGDKTSKRILSQPHQILCAPDRRVICTNTGRNVITVLDLARSNVFQEAGVTENRWDRLTVDNRIGDHLNSVFLCEDTLYVIAHSHYNGSKIATFSYPELSLVSIENIRERTGLHNIWITTEGQRISCHSEIGGIIAYFGERDRRFRERDRFGGFWRCAVSIVVFLSSFGRVRAPERWV